MNSWQVVIELGRKFDVQTGPPYSTQLPAFISTPVITIPFDDRESAEAAQREIRVYVRPVHDAGGEDYRPLIPGEVVRDFPCCGIERGDGNAVH